MKPSHPSGIFLNDSWLPFKSAFMLQQSKGTSCSPEQLLTLVPMKGLLGIYDRYTSKLEPNGQNAVIHLFRRIMY